MKKVLIAFAVASSLFIAFSQTAQASTVYSVNPGTAGSLCTGVYPGRNCLPATTTSINIPTAGKYVVSVTSERGNNIDLSECQAKESFYMIINGKQTPVVRDPDACERQGTIRTQKVSGDYSLIRGLNTIKLFHAHAGEAGIGIESLSVQSIAFQLIETPLPTCTLNASSTIINAGGSSTLTWSAVNATSASINQGIGAVVISGSRSVSPTTTTTYTGTFTGPGGSVNCVTTVTVRPVVPRPTCALSANQTTINAGGSSALTWSSVNATAASINQGVGAVAVNGTKSVSPASTTIYTGTFTGPGGTVTCARTITVIPQPNAPTCRLTATPANITTGGSSILSWVSTNTISVSLNQGIGAVAVNGTKSVSPTGTTTYNGTFTGLGGNVTCNATVTVSAVTPTPAPTPTPVSTPTPVPTPTPEPEEDEDDCDGSIGNYIWNDADGDGVQDDNEKGLANIRVKLTNLTNDDESTLYTTKNGKYEFHDLCEGEYRVNVKEKDVAQYTQTYDPDGTKNHKTEVTLRGNSDDHSKADFGYKGRPVSPRTGSGSMAIYLSTLISLASLAAYLKIKKARAYAKK